MYRLFCLQQGDTTDEQLRAPPEALIPGAVAGPVSGKTEIIQPARHCTVRETPQR
jgi:hypothetical protein